MIGQPYTILEEEFAALSNEELTKISVLNAKGIILKEINILFIVFFLSWLLQLQSQYFLSIPCISLCCGPVKGLEE